MLPPVRAREVIMYFPMKLPVIERSPEMVTDVFLLPELKPPPGAPNSTVQVLEFRTRDRLRWACCPCP